MFRGHLARLLPGSVSAAQEEVSSGGLCDVTVSPEGWLRTGLRNGTAMHCPSLSINMKRHARSVAWSGVAKLMIRSGERSVMQSP